ncbi:hypothetical protein VPLG_00149 [Vibrio phage eugene 12A10]|uniref:hypothetical protein n=1 Tax=Vibrio phage eugene 12A10 TaxID=573172 RepID=UPI000351F893|nr:hypothetical protein VPLG_00149 [Vibrio phage eugene 12A10]AGN51588.1 hypothetical protein VPLG_00149 [Vibrio phage eugene 12A10]
MDNASLEKLIRIRNGIGEKELIVIVELKKSEDDESKYYLVEVLSYTNYTQEYFERKVFKLRY